MARAQFTQAEVRRLIRAAKAEGYLQPAVDTLPGGGLRLLTDAPPRRPASDPGVDLDAELEAFLKAHGDG